MLLEGETGLVHTQHPNARPGLPLQHPNCTYPMNRPLAELMAELWCRNRASSTSRTMTNRLKNRYQDGVESVTATPHTWGRTLVGTHRQPKEHTAKHRNWAQRGHCPHYASSDGGGRWGAHAAPPPRDTQGAA